MIRLIPTSYYKRTLDILQQIAENDDIIEHDGHAAARERMAHVEGVAQDDGTGLDDWLGRDERARQRAESAVARVGRCLERVNERAFDVVGDIRHNLFHEILLQ